MDTGSLPGVNRPGHGVDLSPPSRAEVKEGVELYLYSPCGPSRSVMGKRIMSLKLLLQLVCFVIVTSFLKCVAAGKRKYCALPAL